LVELEKEAENADEDEDPQVAAARREQIEKLRAATPLARAKVNAEINNLAGARVVNVGDIQFDEYYDGDGDVEYDDDGDVEHEFNARDDDGADAQHYRTRRR
jgi:hypothetical protein